MKKRKLFNRTVAGILAVLAVAGNLAVPSQGNSPFIADSATISQSGSLDNSGISWNASTGTLTIKNGITNKDGVVDNDEPDPIENAGNNFHVGGWLLGKDIEFKDVKKIVIAKDASMPKTWYHLFQNFKNLEEFVVEDGVDATYVYDFGWAFAGLKKLKYVDMRGLKNVSTVDYIENMFNGCTALETVYLPNLDGTNAGKRNWSSHTAIDHVSSVLSKCSSLIDFDLSGEYLYNLFCTIAGEKYSNINKMSDKEVDDVISNILNTMLNDFNSPNRQTIYGKLKQSFMDYYNRTKSKSNWQVDKWLWDTNKWTCQVQIKKYENKKWVYDTVSCDSIETIVIKNPSCETSGIKHYVAKWTNKDVTPNVTYSDEYTKKDIATDPLGHSYEESFEWSKDNSSADYVKKCSRCDKEERFKADVKKEEVAATCTEDAKTVYTATYILKLDNSKTVEKKDTKVVSHSGTAKHNYTEFVGFVWSEDGTKAQAKLKCSGCDATTLVNAKMSSEKTEPTCEKDGFTTYTAEYNGKSETKVIVDENSAKGHKFGKPEWIWAEDGSSASATFGCENCGESRTVNAEIGEGVVTQEASFGKNGIITYTATVQFDGKEYTDTKEVEIPALTAELYSGASVGFKENIILRFYAQISDELADGSYVVFTYNHYGEDRSVTVYIDPESYVMSGDSKLYTFDCPLSIPELAIKVTANLYVGGEEESVSEKTDSVYDYCDRMLNRKAADTNLNNALLSLLNLGGYAQVQHHLDEDVLANEGHEIDLSEIEIEGSGEFERPEETVGGVTYVGASLGMRDKVVVRYYFGVDSIDGINFYINDEEADAIYDSSLDMYYIDAEPVKAVDLARVNDVKVITPDGDITFSHSALDYAEAHCGDDALGMEMKALYEYYTEVKNYVEAQSK